MADIRDRLSIRQRRGIFHQQLGYKWEFQHPNLVRVTVPTLPHNAFDNTGEKVLPWHLMKLFDSGELSTYWPVIDDKNNDQIKPVLFMVYYELEIDRSLYDKNTPKFPLFLEFEKKFVKRTSTARSAILRHPSRVKPYAKELCVDVRVDPITREPLPFPGWWKDHFGFPSSGEKPKHDVPIRAGESQVLRTEDRIHFSDTDENGHANFTIYARLCFDSFTENLYAGRLHEETESVFENGIRKVQITFLKEVLMGDSVSIHSWKDETSSETYYFEIKKNGDLCTRVTFIFHKQSTNYPLNRL